MASSENCPKFAIEFLRAKATEFGLDDEQRQVFTTRFSFKNYSIQSSVLAERCVNADGSPLSRQNYNDRTKAILKILARPEHGGPTVPVLKAGRPQGFKVWQDGFDWLWNEQYCLWEAGYQPELSAQQLAQLLLDLDIRNQKNIVRQVSTRYPVSCFSIHLEESPSTRKWVLASLKNTLPRKKTPYVMNFPSPAFFGDWEWFWESLSEYFHEDLEDYNNEDDLKLRLVNLCLEKSKHQPCVLIVSIEKDDISPELEKDFWESFWLKVVKNEAVSEIPFGHCFVTLLVRNDNHPIFQDILDSRNLENPQQIVSNEKSILLNSADLIKAYEILCWLLPNGEQLEELMGQDYVQYGESVKRWSQKGSEELRSYSVLKRICHCTDFTGGLAAVEQYWKSEAVA